MTDLLDPPRAVLSEQPGEPSPPSRLSSGAPSSPLLGALLAGAGAIHFAMAPSHFGESTAEGIGFLVAGVAQLVLAATVIARPRRWALVASIAVNIGLIGAWVWSRTVGLPFGAHAGHAESVSIVDGATVAMEAIAVLAALALLVRPAGRFLRSGVVALVGGLGVLALTTAAIASPAARDHAAGAHGDAGGHDHAGAAKDDLGFAALQNGQMGHDHAGEGDGAAAASLDPATAAELAEQLALTAPLVAAYPTLGAAKAAGYTPAGPFAPGLGIHYMRGYAANDDGDMDPEDIANPYLIFDGTTEDAPLAGFMYLSGGTEAPEGFVGDLDKWHFHTNVCVVFKPDGSIEAPFGADLTGVTKEMCAEKGGSLIDYTTHMVHVWTVPGYESTLGTFSDLNPAITCPDGTYHSIPLEEIGSRDTTCRSA